MFTSDAPIPPDDLRPPLTPRQIELARHALGLDGRRKQSYRNRFFAGSGHDDFDDWQEMVAAGAAKVRPPVPGLSSDHAFWLTLDGAKEALRKGESLDREDFPNL